MNRQYLYNRTVAILLTGVVTVFLCSCKKPTMATSVSQPQLPATVSFSTHIIPVFNSFCNSSGCHSSTSPAAGLNLTPASAYSSLMAKQETYTVNPSGSHLYIVITNGSMPKGATSLSSYDQQLVLKWIQQGALNN